MAWRDMITAILEKSLERIEECVGDDAGVCAFRLTAAADAAYSPLKPVDTGFGEARKMASMLSAVIANAFIDMARRRLGDAHLEFLRQVAEKLREEIGQPPRASEILEAAGLAGVVESAASREARETLVKDIEEYVNPREPTIPRRRRRQTRRPDPVANLKRLLREIGRRDPILARAISNMLRARGVAV